MLTNCEASGLQMVPTTPFSSATVSGWNKPLLIWTGILYSQSSEVSLRPRSRDKNKYRNRSRCDIGVPPEEWQQVSGGMATTSQICHLVQSLRADSYDSISQASFSLVCIFTGEQNSRRSLPLIAEFLSLLLATRKELGVMCSCLKKTDVTPAGDNHSVAHQVIGTWQGLAYLSIQFSCIFSIKE